LWQNSGNSNNWVKLELEGVVSNRDGIGSRIEVYIGADHFIRSTHCGHSYLSQNSSIQTIGVGSETTIDSIIIHWPAGTIDVMRNLNVNSLYIVEEGSSTTDINQVETFVSSYILHQNYPNPFNPSTKIEFNLAVDSKVTLKLFDVLGQEVMILINKNLVAGIHEVNIDASAFNSGVYFYRIEAVGNGTNFVQVRKMLLTK
jgi:hypothetical protein